MPAQELQRGQVASANIPRELVAFLNGLVRTVNGKNADANGDSGFFTLTVESADASDLATAITLANEIKDVLNLLIAYLILVVENDNALRANMRAAELLKE